MIRTLTSLFLIALICGPNAGFAAIDDPTSLDLKVVEGDGATYAPGSRATRGVTVLVNDESGKPVDGASVSFTLPMTGPGGEFASGGRTEIITTRGDGRASVWGMRWNRGTGPFEIRVTAVKGKAQAGVVLKQNLAGEAQAKSSGSSASRGGGHKWLWVALAGAAAAGAAGFAVKGSPGGGGSSTSASAGAVQIGAPSISLGRP